MVFNALRVAVQAGHVNCAHPHERRIHFVSVVALFHLHGAACQTLSVRGSVWSRGEASHVMGDVISHGAELQAANYARSAASLRAHVVAWRASLTFLVFQVAEVARQHIGARARCHYTAQIAKFD